MVGWGTGTKTVHRVATNVIKMANVHLCQESINVQLCELESSLVEWFFLNPEDFLNSLSFLKFCFNALNRERGKLLNSNHLHSVFEVCCLQSGVDVKSYFTWTQDHFLHLAVEVTEVTSQSGFEHISVRELCNVGIRFRMFQTNFGSSDDQRLSVVT